MDRSPPVSSPGTQAGPLAVYGYAIWRATNLDNSRDDRPHYADDDEGDEQRGDRDPYPPPTRPPGAPLPPDKPEERCSPQEKPQDNHNPVVGRLYDDEGAPARYLNDLHP